MVGPGIGLYTHRGRVHTTAVYIHTRVLSGHTGEAHESRRIPSRMKASRWYDEARHWLVYASRSCAHERYLYTYP